MVDCDTVRGHRVEVPAFFQSLVLRGAIFFGSVMPCTTNSRWCTLLFNIVQPVVLYNCIYTMYNRINVLYTFFLWIQACVTIIGGSMTLNKY